MAGRHALVEVGDIEFTADGYKFAVSRCQDPTSASWELWCFGSMWGCFETIDEAVEYAPVVLACLGPIR